MIDTGIRLTALASVASANLLTPAMVEASFPSYATDALSDSTSAELNEEQKRLVSEIPLTADTELPQRLELDESVSIRLLERPLGVLRNFCEIHIKGWDISIRPEDFDIANVKREMIRKFLRLQREARIGSLNGTDRDIWGYIVDHIDYAQYSEDIALPVDFQGILEDRKHNRVTIRWVDGELNYLEGRLASKMMPINVSESFVCLAKFKDSKVVELLDVTPITASKKMDISWIQPLE